MINFNGAAFQTSPTQQILSTNYLTFDQGQNDWAQQYLPELYEQEIERYGDRTVAGFLEGSSAMIPMASDQVIWEEQGRLHIYSDNATVGTAANGEIDFPEPHAIRRGAVIVLSDGTVTVKAYVKDVPANNQILVLPYNAATLASAGLSDSANVKLFVTGSEFAKGTYGMEGAITPTVQTFSNKPIIIKDHYEISGSDATQIGWIEVTSEEGVGGYLWYVKALSETKLRWKDYLEMMMMESETAEAASTIEDELGYDSGEPAGSEGFFQSLDKRGHTATLFDGTVEESKVDVRELIAELDKQASIDENMFFLNRETNLNIDDFLAAQNSYGAGGTSYGVFNNSKEMALNLGFDGFRMGSYDFYKTDWKYLNDPTTRGLIDDIKGVLVPAGTTSVYDKSMGKNVRRPFLHVRYRSKGIEDRKEKSYLLGSVGGAKTSSLDAMQVEFLTERCLVSQATNNFFKLV